MDKQKHSHKEHGVHETNNAKKELEQTKKQAEEYLEGWKRAKADYINLQKRIEKEKKELTDFINVALILKMLPVLDNFNRAFAHVPKEHKDSDWVKGIRQVEKQMEDILAQEGLEKIEAKEKEFNPEFHEAIAHEESELLENTVIDEIEAGYKMHGKVIRPAKVRVSKGKLKK